MVNSTSRKRGLLGKGKAQQQSNRPHHQSSRAQHERSDPDHSYHSQRRQCSPGRSNHSDRIGHDPPHGPAAPPDVTGLIGSLVSKVMNESGIRNMLSTLDERQTSPFEQPSKRSRSVDHNQVRGRPEDFVDPLILERTRPRDHPRERSLREELRERAAGRQRSRSDRRTPPRSDYRSPPRSDRRTIPDSLVDPLILERTQAQPHSRSRSVQELYNSMKHTRPATSSRQHSTVLDRDDPNNSFLFAEDEVPFDELPPEPGRHILTNSGNDHIVIKVDMQQTPKEPTQEGAGVVKERSFTGYDNEYTTARSFVSYDNSYSKSPEKNPNSSADVLGFMDGWIQMQSQDNDTDSDNGQPQKPPISYDNHYEIESVQPSHQLPHQSQGNSVLNPQKRPINHDNRYGSEQHSHERPSEFLDQHPRDNIPAHSQKRPISYDNYYESEQLPHQLPHQHPAEFDDQRPKHNIPAHPQKRRATDFDSLPAEDYDNLSIKDYDLKRRAVDYAKARAKVKAVAPPKPDEKVVCSTNYEIIYKNNDDHHDRPSIEVSSKKPPSKIRQLNEGYLTSIYENSYSSRDFNDNDEGYRATSNSSTSNTPKATPELAPIAPTVPDVKTDKASLLPTPGSTVSQHYAHVARSRKLPPSLHSVIEDVIIIQKEASSIENKQLKTKRSNKSGPSLAQPASHPKPCPVYHSSQLAEHNASKAGSSSYPIPCPTCSYTVLCDAETEQRHNFENKELHDQVSKVWWDKHPHPDEATLDKETQVWCIVCQNIMNFISVSGHVEGKKHAANVLWWRKTFRKEPPLHDWCLYDDMDQTVFKKNQHRPKMPGYAKNTDKKALVFVNRG